MRRRPINVKRTLVFEVLKELQMAGENDLYN